MELGSGSFFGEMALISGEPRSATVSAATEVSLLSALFSGFPDAVPAAARKIADIIRKTALWRRGTTPKPLTETTVRPRRMLVAFSMLAPK